MPPAWLPPASQMDVFSHHSKASPLIFNNQPVYIVQGESTPILGSRPNAVANMQEYIDDLNDKHGPPKVDPLA